MNSIIEMENINSFLTAVEKVRFEKRQNVVHFGFIFGLVFWLICLLPACTSLLKTRNGGEFCTAWRGGGRAV